MDRLARKAKFLDHVDLNLFHSGHFGPIFVV